MREREKEILQYSLKLRRKQTLVAIDFKMDFTSILVSIALPLGWILYRKLAKNLNFFFDRNVPFKKPLPILGNSLNMFTGKDSIVDTIQRLYDEFDNEK